MAAGIWVRLMKRTKIDRDTVVECRHEDWQEALEKACRELDVPRPILLPRHERDFAEFSQARFLPEHFVEAVGFDKLEVEYINPDRKSKVNPLYL